MDDLLLLRMPRLMRSPELALMRDGYLAIEIADLNVKATLGYSFRLWQSLYHALLRVLRSWHLSKLVVPKVFTGYRQ